MRVYQFRHLGKGAWRAAGEVARFLRAEAETVKGKLEIFSPTVRAHHGHAVATLTVRARRKFLDER